MQIEASRSRGFRFLLLGALYFAQGLPFSFVAVTLPLILTSQGASTAQIGTLIASAYLGWTLKPLYGPIIDSVWLHRLGRRRTWLLAAQSGMIVTLLAMIGLNPLANLALFTTLIIGHNLFAALQDVATDALAIDILPAAERGGANSVMWACKYAGVFAGGRPLVALRTTIGDQGIFVMMAVALAVIALLAVILREPAPPAKPLSPAVLIRDLWRSFAMRTTAVGLLAALVVQCEQNMTAVVVAPLLRRDLGFTEEQTANLMGVVSMVAALAGAGAGGFVSDRLGRRRVLVACGLLIALGDVLFFTIPELRLSYLRTALFLGVSSFAQGIFGATLLALFMDITNPRLGATQFAAYMAVLNLQNSWAAKVGGVLADMPAIGRLGVLPIAGAAQVLGLLPLFWVRPAEAQERFRAETDRGTIGESK